jgi:midasin
MTEEETIVSEALAKIQHASERLSAWLTDFPHLYLFIQPIVAWLASKKAPTKPNQDITTSTEDLGDKVIDTLLLTMQNLLTVCSSTNSSMDESAERDNYIKDDSNFVCSVSTKLGLDAVSRSLLVLFTELPRASETNIQTCLGRALPFLEQYAWLVNVHIENQANWTKSLFKLTHVICSIALTIAKDGFCQPKESEEDGEGADGQEMMDGSGLGEGTGKENVSKDIQDESQVEGLQGAEGEQDEQVERAEEGNAIEMSEDFGGAMQDVPEGEEDEDENDDQEGSEADPEERQEKLDATDENTIDEKLWGDEHGPDTNDQQEKADGDHSTKETGQSDVVAKEGEQKSKDREKEKEGDQSVAEQEQQMEEMTEEDEEENRGVEEPNGAEGAPMDEHMQDANTLDLPEELKFEETPDGQEEDALGDMEDNKVDEDAAEEESMDDRREEGEDAMSENAENGPAQATDEAQGQVDEEMDNAVAEADTHAGDGSGAGGKSEPVEGSQSKVTEPQEGGSGSAGQTGGPEGQNDYAKETEPNEYVYH